MKSQALRIGLIGSGDDSSSKLLRLLTEQGMQIVHALLPKELTDAHIAASDLDVWLLDLDDSHWHSQLDELMDRSPVPIFFNEHQSIEGQQHLDYWCRNLISRMFELVADVPGLPPATAATNPAMTARSGETVNPAFAQKVESKPSDDLNVVPTALDPDLLQEMEELEQLLQRQSGKHTDALSDLDAELPLPSATTVAASKAAPVRSEPNPVSGAAPATAIKSAGTDNADARSAAASAQTEFALSEPVSAKTKDTAANTSIDAMPDDPVAAAKARAAKIQQAAAAARANAGAPAEPAAVPANSASKPTSAAAPAAATTIAPKAIDDAAATASSNTNKSGNSSNAKSSAPAPVPAPRPVPPVATAPSATAATPAIPASTPAMAASKPVTPSAPVAPVNATKPAAEATPTTSAAPASGVVAGQKSATATVDAAVAKPVAASTTTPVTTTTPATTSVTTPATTPPATPANQAPVATAQSAASESKPDAAAVPAGKTAADATGVAKPDALSRLAAVPPVVPSPEPHDWPQFPPPVEPTAATAEADPAFAPMQPQPAAGPMREPAKPAPVQLVRAAPASKPARPAATPELPFAEPVPTLTAISDDALEFETVAFEPAEGDGHAMAGDEHPELDVPMLESVVVASDFEAVEAPAPILPCDLWVLGASLGGPAALKRFFAALNQPLPIFFLLAQHIDAHFLPVLGKILEQANPFYPVQVLARPGLIEPGTLLLAPIEKRLRFLDAGQIVNGARSWTPPYSPCIDDVLGDVAAAYPGQVHAIVFSGMGEDGVNGARAVADCRGEVWVQDADSCASSVMPDAIDKAGLARYRATPEELAARLMARYNPAVSGQHLA